LNWKTESSELLGSLATRTGREHSSSLTLEAHAQVLPLPACLIADALKGNPYDRFNAGKS
jgi:hypothetical protein